VDAGRPVLRAAGNIPPALPAWLPHAPFPEAGTAGLGLPAVLVQEGGYATAALADNLESFPGGYRPLS
jgi:hypothetical protein